VVDSYQDLRDALDAVVRCQAIPQAYRVIERFGYKELFPGVIYREENWMDIKAAREIITRAKKDDIYDGPMPEDDATAVTEAEGIVTLAEQAWSQNVRGPEVESILKLAAQAENGGDPESEESGDEHAPPETDEDDAPKRTLESAPEKLQKMEPWEGYADDTVKNITQGINYFIEESPNDALDILEHVYAFEKSHKDRARILAHVQEAYERAGGIVETEKEEATGEATDESDAEEGTEATAEGEGEEGSDDGDEDRSEGSSSEAESNDGESPDAEADTESEIGTEGSEGRSDEEEPSGQSKQGGSESGRSAYQKLVKNTEDELKRERLDIPKPPQEPAPELPWNWNEIKDSDLQEYHMRYAVCAYYKSYRLALHERIAQHCKEAADALHHAKMVSVDKYDEKGKEKKVGLIEAEIAGDSNVKKWRVIQRKNEQLAAADKRELEAYNKIVDSLSRLETMRHNAWERARR
jgi:hypothetical protein